MIEEIPHPDPFRRAFLCGPDGAVPADDVSLEDRQAIADFAAMLGGAPGCMFCMTPNAECEAMDGCCDRCRHVRLVPKTAKTLGSLDGAGSMVHDAPGEVPGPNRPGGD